ncbi:hypothetical protein Tco_0236213 [Tanacetum coccineum]
MVCSLTSFLLVLTLQAFTTCYERNQYLSEAFSMLTVLEIQIIDQSTRDLLYILALADIVAELTWLQALLNELGIRSSSTPIL